MPNPFDPMYRKGGHPPLKDVLEPLIKQSLQSRREYGWNQQMLATWMGTQRSAISRFESGRWNPTVRFLLKLAKALDKKLIIELR